MKNFKMKLQKYKRKMENIRRELKKQFVVFKLKVKQKFIMLLSKIERKIGLKQRCSLCPERIFCEDYSYRPYKKSLFYVERCYSRQSDK